MQAHYLNILVINMRFWTHVWSFRTNLEFSVTHRFSVYCFCFLCSQVDLDLGNYERFLDIKLTRDNNITTGKIYQARAHVYI